MKKRSDKLKKWKNQSFRKGDIDRTGKDDFVLQ